MARGKVKKWLPDRRVGWIIDEADGAEVFFGARDLQGLADDRLTPGTVVEFERGANDRGPTARRVRPAGTQPVGAAPRPSTSGAPRRPAVSGPRSSIPTSPEVAPLPRGLRTLLESPGAALPGRHPGLQLDKYCRVGDQAVQREALVQVAGIGGDAGLFNELRGRRAEALRALGAQAWCRTTAGPLTLHLARASAMENAGICLHPVYGFAYLPGTGLKGMARAYAETVAAAPGADVEAVFGSAAEESCRAGAIVFHDAWPGTWPRLTVDIVNNHHPSYYQDDGPPGDWDAPNPVYFLALPAGTEFSFALGKRRADVDDRLLELARQWLDGALTVLGCGAKTVAGYGSFTGPRPALAGRPACAATLELVAPAFLAGAEQHGPRAAAECDLRPATLRGLLRWWWRTMHAGYLDVGQLAALEAALWGDTAAGGAIQLSLLPDPRPAAQRFDFKDRFEPKPGFKRDHGLADRPNNKTTQGLFYAAYGMDDSRGEKQRQFLDAGATWQLYLTARATRFFADRNDASKKERRSRGIVIDAEVVLQQAEAALWLLTAHGAAGSKSRKGFGSLQARADRLQGMTLAVCKERAAVLRQHLALPADFAPARAESSNLDQALVMDDVPTPWADPWKVLDEVGFAYQAFAQELRHNPDKVALGLPRKIHGPGERPMPNQDEATWRRPIFLDFARRPPRTPPKDARHASPIHIHVARAEGGRLAVRAIAFPTRDLPDLETSQRVLRAFLDHFRRHLDDRIASQPVSPPPRGGPRPVPAAAGGAAPVKVKVLEQRTDGKTTFFKVQELGEGKRPGVLRHGTPPPTLPEVGQEIEVYRSNVDLRSPEYRWNPLPPPATQTRRGPGPRRR